MLDITGWSKDPGGRRMHKKSTFYTYTCTEKSSNCRKIMILFICSYLSVTFYMFEHEPCEKSYLASTAEVAFSFVKDNNYFNILY